MVWVIAAGLLPPSLPGQPGGAPGRTWYIPALGYGPKAWSILRFKNAAASSRLVEVEVYGEDGKRMPIASPVEIRPGSQDVRIDGKTETDQTCWVKVSEVPEDSGMPDLRVEGFVEILNGNIIEDFPRAAHEPRKEGHWVSRASSVESRSLYFLNVAEETTVVTFCAADRGPRAVCQKSGSRAARYVVKPNQSISVQVRKLRRKYFVIETSAPGEVILVMFDDGPGIKRVFSSKSSIDFGEPVR